MKLLTPILACIALVLTAAPAPAQDDIWSHTINNDTNGVWNVQPDRPRPRTVQAPDYLGGGALRVRGRAGANPWDVQATSPIAGAIAQGDVIMLMLYARAEEPAGGGGALPAYIQLGAAPYTSALQTSFTLSGEWEAHCFHTVASADMPGGRANATVHLGVTEQVVDLGPVFVFNFGPDYDRARLADCNG